jgi:hypothetical protein
MRVAVLCIACAMVSTAAAAQSSWQEYAYPEQQFAISFPGEPSIQKLPVKTVEGATAPETLYTVRHDRELFQVAVLDLSRVQFDRRRIVADIVADVGKRAQVKFATAARVQGTFGVYLTMVGRTGNHSVGAVFLANNRLYEVEGTVPATNPDALSGEMARFEQSLRFMGSAAGRVFRRAPLDDDPLLFERLFGPSRFPRPVQ